MRSPDQAEKSGAGDDTIPLPTLLSQALVAFTIEFDNEFERQVPHRTTTGGGSRDLPWLVSMVMWSNFMRFVGEEGVTVGDLEGLTRITGGSRHWLERLEKWWGYVVVEPDPADSRPKSPRNEWVVRPTPGGRKAQEVWRSLFGVIEERWCARFGKAEIDRLREALWALVSRFDVELPEYLPVLGYGLFTKVVHQERHLPLERDVAAPHLAALLSQVLLAFTIEFEGKSDLSLAICSNVLRLLGEEAVRVRDLPRLSGVSKEAISMSVGFLEERRYLVIEPDLTTARTKVVRLTPMGLKSRDSYLRLLADVENRWHTRFGEDSLQKLRESLERLVGNSNVRSPLFGDLEPHPDCWRASANKPETLPHYPMVLHRGGFPDGA